MRWFRRRADRPPPQEIWVILYDHTGTQIGDPRPIVLNPVGPDHWQKKEVEFPGVDETEVGSMRIVDSDGNVHEAQIVRHL